MNEVSVITGLYDAFAQGDVGSVLGAMSHDIVWNEAENFPYADRNPYVGPQSVGEDLFGRIMAEWDGFHLEVAQVLGVEGGRVLATGRYKGTNKSTGKELDAQFAHVWEVKDGKAARFQQYTDTRQAAEVTG